jgi:hypothetical protein
MRLTFGVNILEIQMEPIYARGPRASRLRIVFDYEAVSRSISSGTTYGEIADILQHLIKFHDSGVLAIDVKIPMSPAKPAQSKGVSCGTH